MSLIQFNKPINPTKNKFSKYFKEFDLTRWIAFGVFPIFSLFYVLVIAYIVIYARGGRPDLVFFGLIDRFTILSNCLATVYIMIYAFFKDHPFIKGQNFLISTMTYVTFTFFGYNVILLLISSGTRGYIGQWHEIFSNLILHIVNPLLFILFGFIQIAIKKPISFNRFWPSLLKAMIFPTLYIIYVICAPYIYLNYTNKYGQIVTYSIYGSATNVKDNSLAWVYILSSLFFVFPFIFTCYFFILRIISKK